MDICFAVVVHSRIPRGLILTEWFIHDLFLWVLCILPTLESNRTTPNSFVKCSSFSFSLVMLVLIFEENSIIKQNDKCGLLSK